MNPSRERKSDPLSVVVAVVPAAGASTRFGSMKLLADVGGQPLLQRTLQSLLDADVDRVVLVVAPGASFPVVPAASDPRVEVAVNPDPARGMFSSIQVGLRQAARDAVILVLPADMPFVPSSVIRAVADACRRDDRVAVPVHDRRRGHPVAIPGRYRSGLLAADATSSLKASLAALTADPPLEVPSDHAGIFRDVDVPADLG